MRTHHEGLDVHVGVRRDALQRTSRLAAAAGITRQRQLLGAQASRAEVGHALRGAAAGLDPQGHLLLAFAGPSHEDSVGRDGPPGAVLAPGGRPSRAPPQSPGAWPTGYFRSPRWRRCWPPSRAPRSSR